MTFSLGALLALWMPLASMDEPSRDAQSSVDRVEDAQPRSQRGLSGEPSTHFEGTTTPGPGVESGTANGLGGGRTDIGPSGVTGIRTSPGSRREHARDREADQKRGENAAGSTLRPADAPADMNRHPHAIGSGAGEGGLPTGGANYRASTARFGQAGGVASGSGNPGGAAAQGPAGKSESTQPEPEEKSPSAAGSNR